MGFLVTILNVHVTHFNDIELSITLLSPFLLFLTPFLLFKSTSPLFFHIFPGPHLTGNVILNMISSSIYSPVNDITLFFMVEEE